MNAKERYALWLNNVNADDELYNELLAIKNDSNEIEERFYQELTFGTAGFRGKLGAGTNLMKHYMLARATQSIAQ